MIFLENNLLYLISIILIIRYLMISAFDMKHKESVVYMIIYKPIMINDIIRYRKKEIRSDEYDI